MSYRLKIMSKPNYTPGVQLVQPMEEQDQEPYEQPPDTLPYLTYGDVYEGIGSSILINFLFLVLPRISTVKTPEINRRVLEPRGLDPINNGDIFRDLYREGRQLIKYVIYLRTIKFHPLGQNPRDLMASLWIYVTNPFHLISLRILGLKNLVHLHMEGKIGYKMMSR